MTIPAMLGATLDARPVLSPDGKKVRIELRSAIGRNVGWTPHPSDAGALLPMPVDALADFKGNVEFPVGGGMLMAVQPTDRGDEAQPGRLLLLLTAEIQRP